MKFRFDWYDAGDERTGVPLKIEAGTAEQALHLACKQFKAWVDKFTPLDIEQIVDGEGNRYVFQGSGEKLIKLNNTLGLGCRCTNCGKEWYVTPGHRNEDVCPFCDRLTVELLSIAEREP